MGEFIRMTMADGAEVAVYHAAPEGERRGGLVVVQEIFGVNSHIRSVCDGYAADGYEVLSPALFDREHPGFEVGYDSDGIAAGRHLARDTHPFALTLADTQSCIDALAGKGPVFITGYCYGGSVAWFAATRLAGLAAASCYYGSLIPDAADAEPDCPTICHFGRHDKGIPMAGVEKLIGADHPNVEVFVYEAGHGFNCDQRADYDAASATLARARTLQLFMENGG
ncbi:dienelactone hydrolase family protein [Sphingomonas sp. G-3-2-10]|uniref:dienelactone hydrolase family protein n=1 Tax=Sphingomonas sp. G-3-2-10 TaxID=2728838 RepID=UPI00146B9C8B|nr:dienelactone hydrolase family protein [Sphingomonas sp. G-3-2-10]NML07485.1 dienelactone hydrolase family protein [Sphingomonas sp. G-3-2-10]